jgi:calcineurin-like phosphoesterase family protein
LEILLSISIMNRGSLAVSLLVLAAGCAGPARHVPVDARWLEPVAREAPRAPEAPADRPLRVAVYGDCRGNRRAHQAVVASIRAAHPDLVVFTGDALSCRPAGHLPDLGAWTYIVPFWPQYMRGRPWFSLLTVFPFPAAIHEFFVSPWIPIRDRDGFNAFLEDTAPLRLDDRTPYFFAPGNHDLYHRADRAVVARLFAPPGGIEGRKADSLWFSWDFQGVRFLVLDTGADIFGERDPIRIGGPQLAWLDAKLSDAERRGLRTVVCLHIPPFSSGEEDEPVPAIRETIVRGVLDHHAVDLVLCGHAHAYERIEKPGLNERTVTYIITGGGGAPFHHQAAPGRSDPGSRRFVEETLHFVLLEIGPRSIAGRAIPVVPGSGEGPPGPLDRFEIPLEPISR